MLYFKYEFYPILNHLKIYKKGYFLLDLKLRLALYTSSFFYGFLVINEIVNHFLYEIFFEYY